MPPPAPKPFWRGPTFWFSMVFVIPLVLSLLFSLFDRPGIDDSNERITKWSDEVNLPAACRLATPDGISPASVEAVLIDPTTDQVKDRQYFNQLSCVIRTQADGVTVYAHFTGLNRTVARQECPDDHTLQTPVVNEPAWYCGAKGSNLFKPSTPRVEEVPSPAHSVPLRVADACRFKYGAARPGVIALAVSPFGSDNFYCAEPGTVNGRLPGYFMIGPVTSGTLDAFCNHEHRNWRAKFGSAASPDWFCAKLTS